MTTGRINQIDIYCVSHDIAINAMHTLTEVRVPTDSERGTMPLTL